MTTDRLAVLPSDAVLVHIGPHKTGTTALQHVLGGSRELLSDFGVLYPGTGWGQHREAKALRRLRLGWGSDHEPPPDPKLWDRLVQRVAEHPGRVVLSSEFFAEADGAARARLVDELGPDRVHLIAAARNPARIAVSTWQQLVRSYGRSVSLEDWLEAHYRRVEAVDSARGFWRRGDPANLILQWTTAISPDRVTVIVLDEGDRAMLPATFEQLLGLPERSLAGQRPISSNRGLSSPEIALVREINKTLRSRLTWPDYTRTMRNGVIQRLVRARVPGADESLNQLPMWAIEQARTEAEATIVRLQRSGVRLVGDPASLRVMPIVVEAKPITEIPIDLAAEAVVGAVAVATRNSWSLDDPALPWVKIADYKKQLERANRRVDRLQAKLAKAREQTARARAEQRRMARSKPTARLRRIARRAVRRLRHPG